MLRLQCGVLVRLVVFMATAAAAATANRPASAQVGAFQPQSTLDASVSPQNLSLDAAISSMVRRGLLADVTRDEPRGAAPAVQPVARPVVTPSTPGRPSSQDAARWRRAGSKPAVAGRQPTSTPAARPKAAGNTAWQPTRGGVAAARPLSTAAAPKSTLEVEDPSVDELAPIDDLPETPAPETDAPGDSREPEFGDEQLEGALAGAPTAARGAAATRLPASAPAASSLSAKQLTPVGEPDRIERRRADAPTPAHPESYEVPEPPVARPKLKPLSRNQIALRDKVRRVLRHYYEHPLNTGDRSPWEVMHQMLAFEVHSRILQDGPTGRPVTAVGWLCYNQPCKGRTLMYLNEDGDLRVKVGPALQGHYGQLLALLAQARVRSDYPLKVEGRDFTVVDLIEMEKLTCYPRTELTFKLLGLQRYLDLDARWTNDQGMAWDFPTMLREEMRQPVRTAACGGTHRLSGLILTVKKRQRSGQRVDGAYAEAARFVANYQNYCYRLQNSDGSFSTEWFKGPGAEEDIDRRLKTTGHQLEFMIYASNEEQLTYYRTVKAVNYLANIMWANRDRNWEAGPLGHAIHALVLYDRLVFAPHDGAAPSGPVAARPSYTNQR